MCTLGGADGTSKYSFHFVAIFRYLSGNGHLVTITNKTKKIQTKQNKASVVQRL